MGDILKPEDYAEPKCLLGEEHYGSAPEVRSVPQERIVSKLDDYMSRKDFDGARRHLEYWIEEAKLGNDLRGELLIRNEMIGFFRKTGKKDEAFDAAERAVELLKVLGFEDSVSAGTTYTNAATAYQAFGDIDKALLYFEKAKEVYENADNVKPDLLGGLYNNMALNLVSLERYEEADVLYNKAIELMKTVPFGELEHAITCLNMANAAEAQYGMEESEKKIFGLLDKAYDLLKDSEAPRDGYYAFVCEKCAPTFSYYGYFAAAEELEKISEEIYERD